MSINNLTTAEAALILQSEPQATNHAVTAAFTALNMNAGSFENIAETVISHWNDAHADYTKLFRSFDRDGDVIAAHRDWNAWRNKRPADAKSEAALSLATEVKRYYADALIRRAENEAARQAAFAEMQRQGAAEVSAAEAKINWANATLPPFWTVGAQLGALAAKVAATRPASVFMEVPSMANAPKIRRPANEMIAPVADDVALLAHLDALDGEVAEITKATKSIRAAVSARAKAAA